MKKAILAVLAVGFLAVSCGGGSVNGVKNGVLEADPTITIGKALDNNPYLSGGKWEQKQLEGRDYVLYTKALDTRTVNNWIDGLNRFDGRSNMTLATDLRDALRRLLLESDFDNYSSLSKGEVTKLIRFLKFEMDPHVNGGVDFMDTDYCYEPELRSWIWENSFDLRAASALDFLQMRIQADNLFMYRDPQAEKFMQSHDLNDLKPLMQSGYWNKLQSAIETQGFPAEAYVNSLINLTSNRQNFNELHQENSSIDIPENIVELKNCTITIYFVLDPQNKENFQLVEESKILDFSVPALNIQNARILVADYTGNDVSKIITEIYEGKVNPFK